jgi:hypothetical protein
MKLLEVLLERPAEVVNEGNCAAESRPCTSQLIITSWLVRRRAALVLKRKRIWDQLNRD